MNSSIKLLDKYKLACSITSDNACAVKLGVTRAAVSRWRNEQNHPEADIVVTMCDAIGEPLAKWLPLIESERARTPDAKKAWLRLAQAAAGIAALYLIGLLDSHTGAAYAFAPLYIMRNCV